MILNGYTLPRHQEEVARLISEGKTEKEIANDLGLTPATVKQYTVRLYRGVGFLTDIGKTNRVRLARLVWESSNPVTSLQAMAKMASQEWSKLA